MNTLKPCPFCGEQVFTPLVSSLDNGYTRCSSCGATMQRRRWQTRPIEEDLRKRIAELEELVDELKTENAELKERIGFLDINAVVYNLGQMENIARIAKLESLVERLIEIGDWATIGMVISESYSPSSNMRKLAEDRRNEWKNLVKEWKEREDGIDLL
jgi:uncharacterized Zn finger protein (UPF0148 family)